MSDALECIEGELIDAAHDPARWSKALDSINAFVDGSGAVLLSVDERLRYAPTSTDLAEMMEDYFLNGWHARDRREGCRPLILHKGVAFDHEFLAQDQIEGCDYYADFLFRHGRKWFAGIGANLDGELWCLALQRSPAKGPFVASDLPRLLAVRTRLNEAAHVFRTANRRWLDGAFSAFDLEGSAVIVLDRKGRARDMTEAARSLIAPYLDRSGVLHLTDPQCSRALAEALHPRSRGTSVVTRIPVDLGRRAFTLEVHRLLNSPDYLFSGASFLLRLQARKRDPDLALRADYRLTHAETRVATALSAGRGVGEIAAASSVTRDTVRAHLKAIYAKTATGSQAKLVALVRSLEG